MMNLGKLLAMILLIKFVQSTETEFINNISLNWSAAKKLFKQILNKCLLLNDIKVFNRLNDSIIDNFSIMIQNCLKRKGLQIVDRALSWDIIAISDNIILEKRKNDATDPLMMSTTNSESKPLALLSRSWSKEILSRILKFIQTRTIRISFRKFNQTNIQEEGRHKHHKSNALGQMLMFGLVAAGLIVIPMGFQFLAVLGGKALLLAKLALLLTSIQGLKKIATSNVNYGLYSTDGYGGGHWPYDRKWHYEAAEPYSANLYNSQSSPVPEQHHHYVQPSVIPILHHNVSPRGEDYLS